MITIHRTGVNFDIIFFVYTLAVLHVMEYSLSALSIQLKKVFIFFVKHALDETVLSVAESVIYFHLMLSGDVESNPGPGKI